MSYRTTPYRQLPGFLRLFRIYRSEVQASLIRQTLPLARRIPPPENSPDTTQFTQNRQHLTAVQSEQFADSIHRKPHEATADPERGCFGFATVTIVTVPSSLDRSSPMLDSPLVPRLCLGTHFPEALLRHAQLEAELPESSVPGRAWDGVTNPFVWK